MAQEDSSLPVTSSREPVWTSAARKCYREVIKVLQQARIPCAVGGAFAVHKHTGIWRETKDLDLLLVATSVPEAMEQLRNAGFETYVEDPVWLAKARCGEYFVDLITGIGNASLLIDKSWIERSVTDDVLGIPCKVLAAEEMIASKVFVAFRERFDGADVAHLIRMCGDKLDWDRVLRLLGEHWELLLWSLVLFAYIYPARTDVVPECV
ncbi:MAG TPA: nucleotidyltransferase [Silvibacterium sp.]|nr:nucleotidyltransferase [Silvibacterium sp.]